MIQSTGAVVKSFIQTLRHHPQCRTGRTPLEFRLRILNPSQPPGRMPETSRDARATDFIRAIVAEDVRKGTHGGAVITRFPPEPNGYLHIGHAKSLTLNFGIAAEFGGRCHLRFDDTNPETEESHYVDSIKDAVQWLGFDWGEHLYFASDYFEQMYEFAVHLIRTDRAYVDSQPDEAVRGQRGTVMEPGQPSPYRDRPAAESEDLFKRMRAGEFPNGAHVLRAKIDMSSPNMLLRDPILYRIRHATHYRTGDAWCIYPLYDYAHPIEDALEHITHSLCTLEFENNREFYDWLIESIPAPSRPRQYEFARLVLDYTVMSKRKLLELVNDGLVSGWDDPRMPTIAGLRRRGVTPEAVRAFCDMVGVTKANSRVDIGKLEFAIREDLNPRVPRVLCVLRPLKVVITNYPEGQVEHLDAPYYPHDVPQEGSRQLPFSRELFIEQEDFMESPPKGYYRLAPGAEVRLRYAYIIRCDEVVRDHAGNVTELRCTYDESTRGGNAPAGKTVKGTIHWVSAAHALPCEVRLYDRLFTVPDPDASAGSDDDGAGWKSTLNPESLVVLPDARIEPGVRDDPRGTRYQFERQGYFCSDPLDSRADALVFNRTVTLRDSWAKRSAAAPQRDGEPAKPRVDTPAMKPEKAAAPARKGWAEVDERASAFASKHGIRAGDAEILLRDPEITELFEATIAAGASARAVGSSIINDVLPELKATGMNELAFTPAELARALELVNLGRISAAAGRAVIAEMVRSGGDPGKIVESRGLGQISDTARIAPLVDEVIAENPEKVAEYRAGKAGLLGMFIGQVMGRTGGRADPVVVQRLVRERLGA